MSPTQIIKINPLSCEEEVIHKAAKLLAGGGLVIIPTETVYGIAANALNKKALNRLYEIKNRPKDKPFSILIAQKYRVGEFAKDVSRAAYKLIYKFWPGPLTLVLKSVGQGKVGLRMPDDEIALKIIRESAIPLVCPSANISDQPAPANFEQAIKALDGLVDLALDAGQAAVGRESTVVDLTTESLQILRSGAIKDEEIMAAVNSKTVLFVCTGNSCRSVMAAAYLKQLLAKQKRTDIQVSSAGMMALEGMGVSKETEEVLANERIDVSQHRAQRVTKELVDQSDIILAMEDIHEQKILQFAPEVKNRLFLLKEFAKINDSNLNIPDPVGGTFEFYQNTFLTIKDAVERISKVL
ncbi:MAG: threonylcarbamoyl-AMP synthase [Candidatus Omnitrophica bacterium CG11_big_fil_rev_8_21_14_0_20_43_6]|nr:MAG: threonylcarbamoyl-AMP synthase [Candidatus Omnitrophica bacterium CG11_big_fil_rev_8_21_14_0_20_43_6]